MAFLLGGIQGLGFRAIFMVDSGFKVQGSGFRVMSRSQGKSNAQQRLLLFILGVLHEVVRLNHDNSQSVREVGSVRNYTST